MSRSKPVTPEITVVEKEDTKKIKLIIPAGMKLDRVKIGSEFIEIATLLTDLYSGQHSMGEQVRALRKLKDATKRIRQLEEMVDEGLQFKQIREEIFALKDMPYEIPEWEIANDTGGSSRGRRVPITVWSDWHYGEVVRKNQMSGSNQFNLSIGDRRIEHTVEKTIDVCKNHQEDNDYPGIIVCLGGDMISGDDIHEELKTTNELPTLMVVKRLADRLAWALAAMADEFGHVVVPCVTGNHGRMYKKMQAKDYNVVNFETLLYLMVEERLKDDPRIKIIFPNESIVHFQVYGHRYALTHGNLIGARGGDGHIGAIGPIMRGTMKTKNAESSLPTPRPFDTLIMGHWHKIMMLREVIVNGSLKGYDEFARDFLRVPFEEPMQALWFHGPKGAMQFHHIHCDPDEAATKSKPPGDWVSFRETDLMHWKELINGGDTWVDTRTAAENDNEPAPANDNRDAIDKRQPARQQRRRRQEP